MRIFKNFADTFRKKSFDFICIDAPLGGDMKDYARVDVLGLMPQILNQRYPFSHTLANSERAQLSDCYSFHSVVEA